MQITQSIQSGGRSNIPRGSHHATDILGRLVLEGELEDEALSTTLAS
jgi:hypothetical protein